MKLGIISDIHEDIDNLIHALHILERNSCDEIVCLGDIVGVCKHYKSYVLKRNADECVRLVKENCKYVVVGNHDLFALKKIPVNRGGFRYPDNWYTISRAIQCKLSEGNVWLYEDELSSDLKKENCDYLNTLPEFILFKNNGASFLFSHFLFPDITGSLKAYPSNRKKLSAHYEFVKSQKCNISFCGHVHADGLERSIEPFLPPLSFLQKPFVFLPFGDYKLRKKVQCIAVPAVADTGRQNGVSVIDTSKGEIVTIKMNQSY